MDCAAGFTPSKTKALIALLTVTASVVIALVMLPFVLPTVVAIMPFTVWVLPIVVLRSRICRRIWTASLASVAALCVNNKGLSELASGAKPV